MSVQKLEAVLTEALPVAAEDFPHVYGKDFATGTSGGTPLTMGMFRMNKGEAFPYSYEFDEFKLVVEGTVTVTEEDGTATDFKAGDVIQFGSGSNVKFSSDDSSLMLYVASR
ncbi:cupin domain-containing protein [Jannaschia sp. M317]|uniref:cupin domain-containing protein n=1 Tax=Jannaschia sp. M317 TaxID=2867011 RepID=UPI0021A557AA|nr:cupin domain-containing protein [Jannaschia sp. M317]UWQ19886.1 cupin domain-containing protein [Jannaschia sp. M317]